MLFRQTRRWGAYLSHTRLMGLVYMSTLTPFQPPQLIGIYHSPISRVMGVCVPVRSGRFEPSYVSPACDSCGACCVRSTYHPSHAALRGRSKRFFTPVPWCHGGPEWDAPRTKTLGPDAHRGPAHHGLSSGSLVKRGRRRFSGVVTFVAMPLLLV